MGVFTTSHAVCGLCGWDGPFWAGMTVNLSSINQSYTPAPELKESPASLLGVSFPFSTLLKIGYSKQSCLLSWLFDLFNYM